MPIFRIIDDDEDDKKISTWLEAFKNLFKPISESDINNYHKEYVGSELEKSDLKKAYLAGKGCINYIMEHVPFMCVEDEPRFHEIVNEWIASGEVPEFTAFTKEPTSKRSRRHKKYARESKEAQVLKKERSTNLNNENDDLAKQIMKRQESRGKGFASFMDQLAAKYANGEEEEEEDDLYEVANKKFASKNAKKKSGSKKQKKEETPIKNGRVTKKKK